MPIKFILIKWFDKLDAFLTHSLKSLIVENLQLLQSIFLLKSFL